MSEYIDDEDDDDSVNDFESDLDKWEKNNSTGMSAGKCLNCGSTIYQSTFTDYCMCGESDFAY